MKNIFIIILLVGISMSVSAQENVSVKESIDAATFKSKLESTPGAVVLDVRTPDEVKEGKIPDALNINYNAEDFKDNLSKLDKSKTYFVYCAKGGRSSLAADMMQEMGFHTIYNLEDGFNAWKDKGLPVKKK
jgi:rhodanese-related sulfurtransferase